MQYQQSGLWRLLASLLLALLVLVQTNRTMAQERKGAISGHVTDSSGGVLQGAQVSLEGKGISSVSDVQGQFFINNLDPGTYTVTVTYVGFTKFTQTVSVVSGQVAAVEAKLGVESQNLEVLVTAERPSAEAEAVNRERTADNIVQVLPAEVIRSLPNANMADALGRLPSVSIERDEGEGKYIQVRGTQPRLTNTTIDGVNVPSPESQVRQIKFDAIPADIVESVEINKTLQANMDGDGIGGSVNLVTKTAGERPTISVAGMGGYMPIMGGRGQYETAGTIGQRFGAQKRFGALFGGTYDWSGRGIDDNEPIADVATLFPGQPRYFDGADFRKYRYYRSRWGLAGSADYKLAEGSNIHARFLYSDFHNFGDRWVYSLVDNTPNTGAYMPSPGPPSYNNQIRRPDYLVSSLVLGGKHVLTTTWYAWDLSASRGRQTGQVGDQSASFGSTLASSACQYDLANTKNLYRPQWLPVCFTEAYNLSNYTLSGVNTNHGLSAQVNLQAAGAMAKRYHLGSLLSNFEFGGKFRNAHKFDNTYVVDFTPTGTVPLSQFPTNFSNSSYYGGTYKFPPSVGYQAVRAFLKANPSQFITSVNTQGTDAANYGLTEKVSAGYLMNTLDISSRVRVIAGVRFEGTNLDVRNRFIDNRTTPPTIVPNAFSGSYVKILPSASLRYAFTSNTNLRLVYGRGFSRPDPVNIAQALTYSLTGAPGNQKNQVSLGNPDLKAETADNFDVLIEHYLNPFGMISAGYFYKRLTDPIVTQTFIRTNYQPAPGAPKGTYTVNQPINAGSGWISGFEAAYVQHLTFLPGALRGLGISANYSYTASQASGLPGRSDNPRLLRNAPNTWNISPTYDLGRVSLRLGLSYNQANIGSYNYQDGSLLQDGVTHSTPTPGGLTGPFSDQYFYTHLQVDAQGSVRLGRGLNFIMYGLNLTNEVFGFYQGSPQFMVQREFYTPTIAAGFRWSPTHEK